MNAANKSEQAAVKKAKLDLKPILAWLKQILKKGEYYAGVVLDETGFPSHHLILMAGEASDITWPDAVTWAEKAGGSLPTRREQALLFANLQEKFEKRAYWSVEQHAADADCAWYQNFVNGGQYDNLKSASLRARAVRRLSIS